MHIPALFRVHGVNSTHKNYVSNPKPEVYPPRKVVPLENNYLQPKHLQKYKLHVLVKEQCCRDLLVAKENMTVFSPRKQTAADSYVKDVTSYINT